MEHNITFWEYVDQLFGDEPEEGLKEWTHGWMYPRAAKACELLTSQIEGSENWLSWRQWGRREQQLILPLVVALKIGSNQINLHLMRYDPKDITLHLTQEKFGQMLSRTWTESDCVRLIWEVIGGQSNVILIECTNSCFADILHARHYDEEEGAYLDESVDGGALVVISGAKVDVYAYPRKWAILIAQNNSLY